MTFGDYEIFVHHTPGHCPGGVCLQIGKRGEKGLDLFVGDTLFAGSIGRTDLPGGYSFSVPASGFHDITLVAGQQVSQKNFGAVAPASGAAQLSAMIFSAGDIISDEGESFLGFAAERDGLLNDLFTADGAEGG